MSTSEIAKLESRWRDNPQGLTFAPLAEAYRKQKDARRALEILVPGLERHPDYIPANIVLGRCHWDLNDLEAAEKAFTHVLALDGENVIALKALADITERQSRPHEAERWLETLLVIDRSNDEARDQLARIRAVQSVSPHIETPSALVDAPAAAEAVEPEELATAPAWDATPEPLPVPMETEPERVRLEPPPEPDSDPFPSIADHISRMDEPVKAAPAAPVSADDQTASERAAFPDLAAAPDAFEPFPADDDRAVESAPLAAPAGFVRDDPPFAAPSMPESDGFRFERAEEIVLNVSGGSEFQSPDAANDLMAVRGSSRGSELDSLADEPVRPAGEVEESSPGAADPASLEMNPPSPAALFNAYVAEEPIASVADEPVTPADSIDAAETPYTPLAGFEAYEAPTADPMTAGEPPLSAPGEPDTAEPDLVVTETMAQVFLRQGHVVEALAVYRELSSRAPESERLRERVAELEARRVAMAAPPPRPSFLARDTGGQSLGSFFAALLASRPASGPTGGGDGFGGVELSPETAPATRPAEEPLSLGSVFGEDPPGMAPAVPPANAGADAPMSSASGGAAVSFDDFFAGAQVPAPAPAAPARAPRSKPDDDLDQFHTWLQGLKR